MSSFTIDDENNITAHAGLPAGADESLSFSTPKELAKLTADSRAWWTSGTVSRGWLRITALPAFHPGCATSSRCPRRERSVLTTARLPHRR